MSAVSPRFKQPVFIVGCPRSGTTLLYHLLLSSGQFAIYRTETWVYSKLGPRFGNFRERRQRESLMDLWLNSDMYRLAGIEAEPLRRRIIEECHSSGDFLRILMESIAAKQNVPRWADDTPTHVLYMRQIKQDIPNALFLHIIRDGRDTALSIERLGWVYPLPGDNDKRIQIASIFWEWTVNQGRKQGRELGDDYAEVRYEELVQSPHETVARVGEFIGQDLDYDELLKVGVGSVRHPQTAFPGAKTGGSRKELLEGTTRAEVEMLIGETLHELGYGEMNSTHPSARLRLLRSMYHTYFSSRHRLKSDTALGRLFVTLEMLQPGYLIQRQTVAETPIVES